MVEPGGSRRGRALFRAGCAAAAALYLTVLASAAPHQIHHAGKWLADLLRPAPAHDHVHGGAGPHRHREPVTNQGAACPLASALAWKGADLPAPPPAGVPAGVAVAPVPPALFSHASFDPASLSIRAPPRRAAS